MPQITNILTVDVEEYFQVSGFEPAVAYSDWPGFASRVEAQVSRILDMLDRAGARATFFVLGWTAERHPGMVREIALRGHEVASHGYRHRLVYEQGPRSFRRDVRRAQQVLAGILRNPVFGYRAPSFSIVGETTWALSVLRSEGVRYDSSVVPISHDRYGIPGARPGPHRIELGDGDFMDELPPLTRTLFGRRFAAGGGGWFRLFPLAFTRSAIRRANEVGDPATIYLHPWELDPGQPRIAGTGRVSRFRHFVGMKGTEEKLERLLDAFPFHSAAEHLGLAVPTCRPKPDRPAVGLREIRGALEGAAAPRRGRLNCQRR